MVTRRSNPDEVVMLHLCTRYQRGGSEQRISDIVTALDGVGHHVVIGAESDVELARTALPAAEVSVDPHLVRAPAPRSDALALAALVRRIRSGRYAVVVSHQSKAGALVRAAALASPRFRWCIRCPWPASGPATGVPRVRCSGSSRRPWGAEPTPS